MRTRDTIPWVATALLTLAGCSTTTTTRLSPASPSAAQTSQTGPACTDTQAEKAWATIEHLQGWTSVHRFYHAYRTCDEGGIAEGNAEAVSRLLADHWDSLGELAALTHNNVPFRTFVLDHINSTLATRDLETIAEHANTACSTTAARLCQAIGTQARRALHEQKHPGQTTQG